jgi:hypothetical protein
MPGLEGGRGRKGEIMSVRPDRLWRRIGRESLWGRRGLIKLNPLWLPAGLILLGAEGNVLAGSFGRLAAIAAAVFCWSFASTLANDWIERREDLAAGKTRWIGSLPDWEGGWIPGIFAAAGLAVLVLASAPVATLAAYAGAVFFGTIYSLRPFRWKERGALGLAAYGGACAIANVLVPWTWFGGDIAAVAVPGVAVFLDKWVNLQFHQILDHDDDAKQGTATYAVRAGLDEARRALRPGTVAASLALITAAAYGAWRRPGIAVPILIAAAGCLCLSGIHETLARRRPDFRNALSRELPWTYLGLTLGLFRAVPLVLFWDLALREPAMKPALAAIAVLLAAEWALTWRYRYE